jgi:hypothetical protein
MSEVFITRKGGGAKSSAPELLITEVGGSWIELEVTNTDQVQAAQIFLLANYDTNSTEDFDILAIQNGKVITVAAGATATEIIQGLDNQVTNTISAQAAVIKKLPSSIVTTDPTNLLQTGLPAPTIGTLVEVNDTTLNIPLTNNETTIPLTIRVAVTTSTAIPTNYPFSEIIGALSTTSVTVSNLTPLTVYYIHARAFDGNIQSANVTFGPYTKQETPLYAFTSWTFTTAGVTGRTGPNITQVRSAYSSQTWAQNNAYLAMTTNGIQNWTVPVGGTYRITAIGARGKFPNNTTSGTGARMRGDFSLTKGQVIRILVGQEGETRGSYPAAGGGTFVAQAPYNTLQSALIVAGGGGGGGGAGGTAVISGWDPNAVTSTTATRTGSAGNAGPQTDNSGGCGGSGNAGAGFLQNSLAYGANRESRSFVNGGVGGEAPANQNNSCVTAGLGGFGGGGGSGNTGGGGGGYAGGANHDYGATSQYAAGVGGSSYNGGTNQSNSTGIGTGQGSVTIQKL